MERLADPCNDRVVATLDPPPSKPLSRTLLYPKDPTKPDWRVLANHLAAEGRLAREDVIDLCHKVQDLLSKEANLVRLKDPVTVVGDIHGQFYDFLKLLDVGGNPDETKYLFLGDYVDRGSFSLECLLLLFALKINHPDTIFLLRGNHECRQMTAFFNFRDECEHKHDAAVYQAFVETFDAMPLAALVNGKFLAVHGGLSPELKGLTQLSRVDRFQETPRSGMFCDLLWSDPIDEEKPEHVSRREPYFFNDVRGCSYFFGHDATSTFLENNGLLSVIRAHEAQLEGYKMHKQNPKTGFPQVITIFSAPNYCDCYNNKGAILKFNDNTLNIQQFNLSPHPYHLPNFMDVFSWSIPFVSEKVTEMLYALLKPSLQALEDTKNDDSDSIVLPDEVLRMVRQVLPGAVGAGVPPSSPSAVPISPPPTTSSTMTQERREALRKKVQSVSRLMRMFRTLREHNETVVLIKNCTPGHRIPMGVLLQGGDGLKTELQRFQVIKQADLINEKRPDGIS